MNTMARKEQTRSFMNPRRLLILGQSRTGTTALYLSLKAALPPETCCVFEPDAAPQGLHQPCLVKLLYDRRPDGTRHPVKAFAQWDQCLLVRDPRDRLVSLVLFLLHWQSEAYPLPPRDDPQWPSLWTLLHRKETTPQAVPFWQLFAAVMALRFGWTGAQGLRHLQQDTDAWLGYLACHPQASLVRYESLLKPDGLAPLGARLHLPVRPPGRPAGAQRSVYRAGWHGEWRQWFLEEDCTSFAPLYARYLQTYYAESPDRPAASPQITPRTASGYVQRWRRLTWRHQRYVCAHPA